MRAVRIHNYGEVDQLKLEDTPAPQPKAGEVLVRVAASSVNPFDCKLRHGDLQSFVPLSLPAILGGDFAGEVTAAGEGVSQFKPGDRVYGTTGMAGGAYAEYVAISASEIGFAPRNLPIEQAGALPAVSATAYAALFLQAPVSEGQTVLIHGAAGGVGSIAVQLAKWAGAKVYGTGSAGSADLVRSLGADVFIDYHSQKFEDVANDVDLVLDTVGGETLARSWAVLKPGGTLASIVQPPDPAAAEQANAKGVMVYGHVDATARAKLTELIEAGHVRPVIDQTFSLAQISDAHRYVETGHAHGKVVLRVDGSIA